MLFNQSKVCLNIHQEFTKNALNIRTFEIIGAGQIQLVEAFNSVKLTACCLVKVGSSDSLP